MNAVLERMQVELNKREREHSLRTLHDAGNLIDFSSNDYLGLAKQNRDGATGSRLISGNYPLIEGLEETIASFHGMDGALFFNSGYTANLGLISTITKRSDLILYDEYIHASLRDGIRLSHAQAHAFDHNDLESLETKLVKNKDKTVFVLVESVYSMDGDSPDLEMMVSLCEKYNANLIVDEAHAVGICGQKGQGLVYHLGLSQRVFAVVITYGKAFGLHGAAILGNNILKLYLINFCRSFIYTTAPAKSMVNSIKDGYVEMIKRGDQPPVCLELKHYFIQKLPEFHLIFGGYGAIVSLLLGSVEKAKMMEKKLKDDGLYVKAILSPTVPDGKERLRICFHDFNTINEVNRLIAIIKEIL